MRKRTRIVLALLLIALACVGTWYYLHEPEPPLAETVPLVEGNTEFALRLFAQVRGGQSNLIFSPYSISCALAMIDAGARGRTAQEIERIAAFPEPATNLARVFHALDVRLDRARAKGKAELTIANALWTQTSFDHRRDFVDSLKDNYRASVKTADFTAQPEQARAAINQWVDESTRHKIHGVFGPGDIEPATRVVVANAIYFKGTWAIVFPESATHPGEFIVNSNRTMTVPMMTLSGEFHYFSDTNLQCIALPYRKQQFEMVILLPRGGGRSHREPDGPARGTATLDDLERSLNQTNLENWLSAAHKTEISATIPKFRMSNGYALKPVLQRMGMKESFEPNDADFSGISAGTNLLFLSTILHQAIIEVNEKGTEAAAVSGESSSSNSAAPMEQFVADHPFLFFVRETGTGTILFMGRVVQPQGDGASEGANELN